MTRAAMPTSSALSIAATWEGCVSRIVADASATARGQRATSSRGQWRQMAVRPQRRRGDAMLLLSRARSALILCSPFLLGGHHVMMDGTIRHTYYDNKQRGQSDSPHIPVQKKLSFLARRAAGIFFLVQVYKTHCRDGGGGRERSGGRCHSWY